jgi:pimeloyl-ACP methyl ester carboxylesterase
MPSGSWIQLENARIYVEIQGTGQPVLLLHGMALDRRTWDAQMEPLSEQYRVVRIDLHGFGKSSTVDGAYSHAEILEQLVNELDIERPHLVGHSMGGRIAAQFVQTHPGAAASLTLLCADVAGLPFKTLGPAFGKIFDAAQAGDIDGAKRLFLGLGSFDSLRQRPGAFALVERMVNDYSGWLFANVQANPERRPTPATADVLHAFQLPTLVVTGELDVPDFQDIADEVVRRVPGARRLVLPRAGHMPNLEQPDAFHRALIEFWNAQGARAP